MSKFLNILSTVCLLAAFIGCEKTPDDSGKEPGPGFQRYQRGITYDNNAKVYKSTYQILLPADYESNLDTRYPVVYMLHGYGESGKDWGNWKTTIESLEENGLQPMIYVFPDCNNSYYCNYYDEKAMYMNMIVEDLIPLIDETYRTIADREHRAVMGYSMGGFGAMVLPLKNPDTFSISVSLSMSFRTDEQYMTESQSAWDNQWGKIFGGKGQNGEGRLTDYYKEHCPFYQFIPENKEELSKVKWFLHCGDDEEQLLIANDNLHVQLRDYGYAHEFRISDGGHSGSYWRTAARETLPWIEHVMNGGGEWTKVMKEVTLHTSSLNEDGSFTSTKFKDNPADGGLAIYLTHMGLNDELIEKIIGMLSQSGQIFPYMILPCDLGVKPLTEWIDEYTQKYGIGGTPEKSHAIAIGDTGKHVYKLKDLFNAYYYIDADITDDEDTIVADIDKRYFIFQTDESKNYKDMNALYRACKSVVLEDGSIDEAEFEYRMINNNPDKEHEILLSVQSMSSVFKYK